MDGIALYYVSEAYRGKSSNAKGIMGRQAAGEGFLRALAASKYKRLWCYGQAQSLAEECRGISCKLRS